MARKKTKREILHFRLGVIHAKEKSRMTKKNIKERFIPGQDSFL
ncbi:MAG: hypothetical protein U9Q18_06130 [Caldisericota bacterium]|nr:hypothetical protein [Caldisericota bacterium]